MSVMPQQAAPLAGDVPGMEGANLNNTLTPQGILTQMQAEMARQSAARAAAVEAATSAATKAGAQYGQAAAAPAPQVDPLTRLGIGMGGDVASIMARNPRYANEAQNNLDQQHADLTQSRAQNLAALRDIYGQRADAARQIGNQAVELDSREKMDRLGKALDVMLQGQRETAAEKLEGLRTQGSIAAEHVKGQESRATNAALMGGMVGGAGGTGAGSGLIKTDRSVPYVDVTEQTLPKAKQAVQNLAHQQTANGTYTAIVGPKEHQQLKLIDNVKAGLADVYDQALQWLPKSVNDPQRGLLGIRSLVDPGLKSWGANRMQAVSQVSALMSAGTGGRMNQQMIQLAILNDLPDPGGIGRPSDWVDSAQRKYQRLSSLFDNYEAAVLGKPGAVQELQAQVRKDYAAAKAGGVTAQVPVTGAAKASPTLMGGAGADEAAPFRKKKG